MPPRPGAPGRANDAPPQIWMVSGISLIRLPRQSDRKGQATNPPRLGKAYFRFSAKNVANESCTSLVTAGWSE